MIRSDYLRGIGASYLAGMLNELKSLQRESSRVSFGINLLPHSSDSFFLFRVSLSFSLSLELSNIIDISQAT